MPAKAPVKSATKASATPVTVAHSNWRRAPNGALKGAVGATSKAATRNAGKAKPKSNAPIEENASTSRSKVKKYSYNMPKSEHDTIVALKGKLNEQGIKLKKSELIRLGIHLLGGLSDARIKASLQNMSTLAHR